MPDGDWCDDYANRQIREARSRDALVDDGRIGCKTCGGSGLMTAYYNDMEQCKQPCDQCGAKGWVRKTPDPASVPFSPAWQAVQKDFTAPGYTTAPVFCAYCSKHVRMKMRLNDRLSQPPILCCPECGGPHAIPQPAVPETTVCQNCDTPFQMPMGARQTCCSRCYDFTEQCWLQNGRMNQ